MLARTGTQVRRKRLQDRLQQNYQRGLSLALTDELTGLYERRYLLAHLDELIERVNQDGLSAAVLMLNVDHFKRVNDRYGHDAGDDVLRELAARTIDSVRSVDFAARWGGEEFVVVMPETDLANAAAVAEPARPVVRPAKAGMFSRRKACRGKSQKPRSLDSRVAGNQKL